MDKRTVVKRVKDLLTNENMNENSDLRCHGPEIYEPLVSEAGIQFLFQNADKAVKYKYMAKYIRQLVRFLSPAALPRYLASGNDAVRELAKYRLQEAKEGYDMLFECEAPSSFMVVHVHDPTAYSCAENSFKFCRRGVIGTDIHTPGLLSQKVAEGQMDAVLLLNDHEVPLTDDLLVIAASYGRTEIARYILAQNLKGSINEALVRAVEKKYVEVVKLLLDNGADVHVTNDAPLYAAAKEGMSDIIRLLLEYGADASAGESIALRRAIYNKDVETVKLLLEHGVDVNDARNGALEIIIGNRANLQGVGPAEMGLLKMLLTNGADEVFMYRRQKLTLRQILEAYDNVIINEALAKGWEPFPLGEAIVKWIESELIPGGESSIALELNHDWKGADFCAERFAAIYDIAAEEYLQSLQEAGDRYPLPGSRYPVSGTRK